MISRQYLLGLWLAGHRMQEQKAVYDVLHLLKILHPEKSFMELHQLLRFAAVRRRNVNVVRFIKPSAQMIKLSAPEPAVV